MKHLLDALKTNNMSLIIKNLRDYLNSISMIGYEPLIVNLIKISIIENDFSYLKVINILERLANNTYRFDVNEYIGLFYDAIDSERANVAKIYLRIIIESGMLNNKPEKLTELKTKLESVKEVSNEYVDTGDIDKDIRVYLKKQYELLLAGRGIVLLRNLRSNVRKKLESLVLNYPDIDTFTLGEQEKRILVLRYVDLENDYINVDEINSRSEQVYRKKEYEKCIEVCMPAVTVKNGTLNSGIYGRIGQAHLMLGNKRLAWDYLTVSKNLGRNNKKELISNPHSLRKLERKVCGAQSRPSYPNMYKKFNSNMNYYYTIKNVEELIAFINASNLDVASACIEFGLTYDKIDIIRLIIAREYFYEGEFSLAEEFIKAVEKSPYKNFEAIKLLEIVRKNKNFYCNRENEKPLGLILTLKP